MNKDKSEETEKKGINAITFCNVSGQNSRVKFFLNKKYSGLKTVDQWTEILKSEKLI